MNNQRPLFLAVALTALLVIGGAFCFMEKRQVAVDQPAVADPVIETPTQTEEVEKSHSQNKEKEILSIQDLIDEKYDFTQINTSDWKDYRNETVGFQTKIPKNWFCGGVALAPSLTSQFVCLEEKEKENYYNGKYTKHNLIMLNTFDSESSPLRDIIMLDKKGGAKAYIAKTVNETIVITAGKNYTNIYGVTGDWVLVGFPGVEKRILDGFVSEFKYMK